MTGTRTPRPGDFGLTRVNGAVGIGIRVGQWLNGDGFRDYEHAFMVVDRGMVVEAEPGGARLTSLSEYLSGGRSGDTVFSSWPLNSLQRVSLCTAARAMVGTPYSALDYFAIAAHRFHLWAPGLKSYVSTSKHVICSQLVDTVYRSCGIELFHDDRWPGYVSPASLLQALTGPVG